jgi:c-di-GMP-related signal transduction protein
LEDEKIVFQTQDGMMVKTIINYVAKKFSSCTKKQECFLNFTKENQIKWCSTFFNRKNLVTIEHKIIRGQNDY